jgi:hypothetical protein
MTTVSARDQNEAGILEKLGLAGLAKLSLLR